MTGPAPHIPAIAGIAVAALGAFDQPVTLVAHSGAGALVPAVVAAVPGAVGSVVFVDATLPYPGRTWFDSAPVELVDRLRELAGEGEGCRPGTSGSGRVRSARWCRIRWRYCGCVRTCHTCR